eukprot:CAMPEP_0195001910 /NCGR_PEP_ID=MMETSP0326_2-20130528/1974_1 /TAXON_ID=2866 ORGANISM="Crypthecodinium cohnii, Strain Seligo" /NCGR_SAMPLE_ID=MMETSP0326_2 /ASSEMBLY_ACC=CAM_ASM_000348 /LENGTH=112 /DNA_ID=CAMNT_0040004961 /DNA_START=1224 /DNA_END=1561 /DNA_ORIENTATION=+
MLALNEGSSQAACHPKNLVRSTGVAELLQIEVVRDASSSGPGFVSTTSNGDDDDEDEADGATSEGDEMGGCILVGGGGVLGVVVDSVAVSISEVSISAISGRHLPQLLPNMV